MQFSIWTGGKSFSYLEWITWCWSCYICGCASTDDWTAADWAGAAARCSVCRNWQHIDIICWVLFNFIYLYWLLLSILTDTVDVVVIVDWSFIWWFFTKSHRSSGYSCTKLNLNNSNSLFVDFMHTHTDTVVYLLIS